MLVTELTSDEASAVPGKRIMTLNPSSSTKLYEFGARCFFFYNNE